MNRILWKSKVGERRRRRGSSDAAIGAGVVECVRKASKLTTAESSAIAISLAQVRSPHQAVEANQLLRLVSLQVDRPGTPGCIWYRVTDRPLLAAIPSRIKTLEDVLEHFQPFCTHF